MKSLVLLLLFIPILVNGQPADTLTLFECYDLAIASDPLSMQKLLLESQNQLKMKNASVNWYPTMDINGNYSWQSEVIELGLAISIPGIEIPAMPQYNYRLNLDIQQALYDGGATRAQKMIENSNLLVGQQKVEIELNNLKERINYIYFCLLTIYQQELMVQVLLDELKQKRMVVESGFKNGILLSPDLDQMDAELLKAEQQMQEIRIFKASLIEVLQMITGIEMDQQTVLVIPDIDLALDIKAQRLEYQLFDLQIENLDANRKLVRTQRNPKIFAFGSFGYGNPGLNFFRDEFHGYYTLGAGVRWKLWDWGKTGRDQQIITAQQDIVRTNMASFDRNLKVMLEDELAKVRKLEEMLKTDREIVSLLERITRNSASQLENGIIRSTDYISDLNAEVQARIQLETHKIQLVHSIVNYMTQKGLV